MPTKTILKGGTKAKVTFALSADAEQVAVAGDFNDWSEEATPLVKRKDGRFTGTVTVPTGREYRYRYVIDGETWENDGEADWYAPNAHGSEDCVIDLTDD